jgi:hypothetical protein
LITIRRSHLEEFRKLVDTEYGDEPRLIDAVRGLETTPTHRMLVGTAWHRLLELDTLKDRLVSADGGLVTSDALLFRAQDVVEANQITGWGLREVPGARVLDVGATPVLITAVADHLAGLTITDHKTTLDAPDLGSYEPALQWRVYLWVHDMRRFRYLVWHMKEPKKEGEPYALKGHGEASFFPYPDLVRDLTEWVARFLDWCHRHRLTEFLEKPYDGQETIPA